MASFCLAFNAKGTVHKQPIPPNSGDQLKTSLFSTVKPFLQEWQKIPLQVDVSKAIKKHSLRMLDMLVDSVFEFVDQPIIPSQKNFAPVEEIGGAVKLECIEGEIPSDFPEGVYMRNGGNPLFGHLKSTVSVFGRSTQAWVEGEGMMHAVYFTKDAQGNWSLLYNNRYVQSKTFKEEKQGNKPLFLPALIGDSTAVLAGLILNALRFGVANKDISNTSIIEHGGRYYAIAENHRPQEIDICTLETLNEWDVNGTWVRPFTSHPKKAPGTGELVIMGIDAMKPYYEVGVISADGERLIHKVDLKLDKCVFSHDIGVTLRYNIIMDFPLTIDFQRVLYGGELIQYEEKGRARIGVMPRQGEADSVKWFEVKPHCSFHILNCFEDGNEVVVRGCRAEAAIVPGPRWGSDSNEWFSKGFRFNGSDGEGYLFSCVYEWRLNMETGKVKEINVLGTDFSMDFPIINEKFTGLRHKYGYTQVIDALASSTSGRPKYGGFAKLYFDEANSPPNEVDEKDIVKTYAVKIEYHKLEENEFCTGIIFVAKPGNVEEDDGWIVSFVHNEDTDGSHVVVIDAKKFEEEPIAKIMMPQRVPYGFHAAFFSSPEQH